LIIFYGIPFAISISRWFVYKRQYHKKSFFEIIFVCFFITWRKRKPDPKTVKKDFDMKQLWVAGAKMVGDLDQPDVLTERSQLLPSEFVNKGFAASILNIGRKDKEKLKPRRHRLLSNIILSDSLSKSQNHLQWRQEYIRSRSSCKGSSCKGSPLRASPLRASPLGKGGVLNKIFFAGGRPMAINKIVPSAFTPPTLPMAAIPEIQRGKIFS
jgi:hypothetical protein